MKSVKYSCFPLPATFNIAVSHTYIPLSCLVSHWKLQLTFVDVAVYFSLLVNAETFFRNLIINFRFFFLLLFYCKHFQVEGTLSVQPQANPVVGFEQHFLGLTVENNRRNPWFVGKWTQVFFFFFQCVINCSPI